MLFRSSQYAPGTSSDRTGKIVKFNWNQPEAWDTRDLTNDSRLKQNFQNAETEFESIQVIGENHLYLTVAYHNNGSTVGNQIFDIRW